MKKLSIVLIFFGLLFLSCKQENEFKKELNNTISIQIDDRIELFRIAYNLALEDSIDLKYRPCKNNYYKANYLIYNKYSNHPLVQKIRTGDIWKGDLPFLTLCLNENLEPIENIDHNKISDEYGWFGQNLDSLSKLLIDFKKSISFNNNYNVDLKPFKDSIKSNKIPEKLNHFFRIDKKANFNILFDPLNNITNKAITFTNNKNDEKQFVIGYYCDYSDTSTDLKLHWNNDYRRIIIHENCHLYTNDLFLKYYDTELDSLIKQVKFKDDYTDIDEIIVRGLTSKILELKYGKEIGEYEINGQPKKSKIVYGFLEGYIKDDKMKFEDTYKEIIELIKKEYL